MAITKAQQARQMLIKGGVVHSDGRRGFFVGAEKDAREGRGDISPGTDRQGNQRDGGGNQNNNNQKLGLSPLESKARFGTTKYAGLNLKDATDRNNKDQEAKKIADAAAAEFKKNLKIKEQQEKERKQRILDEQRRKQQEQLGILGRSTTTRFGNPNITGKFLGEDTNKFKDIETLKSLGAIEEDDEDDAATAKAIGEQNAIEKFLGKIPSTTNILKNILPKDPFGNIIGEITDDPELLEKVNKRLDIDLTKDAGKKKYSQLRTQGVIGAYGRPMGGFREGPVPGSFTSIGGEQDNQIIPQVVPTTTAPTTTTTTSDEDVDDIFKGELAARFGGSLFDFDKLRANAMDGGIMNTDVIGGFADDSMDEMGRQMYGLGKLVKKVTRGVKKIAKSPIGKAALLYFGGNALTGGGLKSFLLGSNAGPSFSKTGILKKMFLKNPSLGFSLGNISPVAGIFGTSALAGLMTPKQEEENEEQYLGPSFDAPIPAIRARRRLAAAFDGSTYNYEDYADGGRIGYQDGSKEPVAKKTMPLIDMDGMEKDYRETGGFVEMGRMERADDVPARLSKNEFVFTADAVRNAGDGNVDKGAEVMYNMMKNLESGGEVSEESQGLEGARKMFQTSQRLGEVI